MFILPEVFICLRWFTPAAVNSLHGVAWSPSAVTSLALRTPLVVESSYEGTRSCTEDWRLALLVSS